MWVDLGHPVDGVQAVRFPPSGRSRGSLKQVPFQRRRNDEVGVVIGTEIGKVKQVAEYSG